MGLPSSKHKRSYVSNILQNVNCSVLTPPGPTYWPTHQNSHPDKLDFFISSRHINYTISNLDDPACDHSPILMQISGKTTQNPPHLSLAKGPINWDHFSKHLENFQLITFYKYTK